MKLEHKLTTKYKETQNTGSHKPVPWHCRQTKSGSVQLLVFPLQTDTVPTKLIGSALLYSLLVCEPAEVRAASLKTYSYKWRSRLITWLISTFPFFIVITTHQRRKAESSDTWCCVDYIQELWQCCNFRFHLMWAVLSHCNSSVKSITWTLRTKDKMTPC